MRRPAPARRLVSPYEFVKAVMLRIRRSDPWVLREQGALQDRRQVEHLGQRRIDPAISARPSPAFPGMFFRPEEDAFPSEGVDDAPVPAAV